MLPKLRRSTDKHLTDAASGIAGLQKTIIDLRARVYELETKLGDIVAGCDIQKDHGLFRQVRVVIGPGLTQAEIDRDAARAVLREVREVCLFSEDDDRIGVTEEPRIDSELFNRICAVLPKEAK